MKAILGFSVVGGVWLALSAVAAMASDQADARYQVVAWDLPVAVGSLAPDLSAGSEGRVLMTWMERGPGRDRRVQLAIHTPASGWASPRTVAQGSDLIANAADTPHVVATSDGVVWVQWLASSKAGAAGYDVLLSRSGDEGAHWDPPITVNDDGLAAEHGFAALWAQGKDALGIVWLDGREQAAAVAGSMPMHHGQGATQVRSNRFDRTLQRAADTVLDTRSCDCCQTALAMTARGPLLAWRDRDDKEVRDIVASRFDSGQWSDLQAVHRDGWRIEACPVAGPAVAANGEDVIAVWYTEAGGEPSLQLARSHDAGAHFAAPVRLDAGHVVLGRAAVAIDSAQVWVAWFREQTNKQALMLARYSLDLKQVLQTFEVATLAARGMASGYPRMLSQGDGVFLVWTDVEGAAPQLRGVHVRRD